MGGEWREDEGKPKNKPSGVPIIPGLHLLQLDRAR